MIDNIVFHHLLSLIHHPLAHCTPDDPHKQIARIHFFQGNWNESIMEIESIPSKHRSTGIQLLLAKCYERLSCNRAAKATYAEAIRGQSLAVEAVLSLASLNSAVEHNDRYDELCQKYVANCLYSCDDDDDSGGGGGGGFRRRKRGKKLDARHFA